MKISDAIQYLPAIIAMFVTYIIMAFCIGDMINDGILGAIIALAFVVVILIFVVKIAERNCKKREENIRNANDKIE